MQRVKICSKCKEEKNLWEFYKHKGHKDGLMSSCKKCTNDTNKDNYKKHKAKRLEWAKQYRLSHKKELKEWGKNWYKKNKEKVRNSTLLYKYGLSITEYNYRFSEQNGCCVICEKHQSELTQALAVDHCHENGKVRGLLCSKCNIALGNVDEDINILLSMVDYLIKNKGTE